MYKHNLQSNVNPWSASQEYCYIIGMSVSEPHTNPYYEKKAIVMYMYVCMYMYMYVCVCPRYMYIVHMFCMHVHVLASCSATLRYQGTGMQPHGECTAVKSQLIRTYEGWPETVRTLY